MQGNSELYKRHIEEGLIEAIESSHFPKPTCSKHHLAVPAPLTSQATETLSLAGADLGFLECNTTARKARAKNFRLHPLN